MTAGPAEVLFADVNNDLSLDIVTANVNWADRGASVLMQGICEGTDCNGNGIGDICDLPDCNINGIPDACDISSGNSSDFDGDGIPDDCQEDCNGNGVPDSYELATGIAFDCNQNGILDICDWPDQGDCDNDGIIDGCEIDVNNDFVPDDCQCIADFSGDGVVAIQDILLLIAAWGTNPVPHGDPVPEDINVDSVVDVLDLLYLIGEWGACSTDSIPDNTGACCMEFSPCAIISPVACAVRQGVYMGDNTTCETSTCTIP